MSYRNRDTLQWVIYNDAYKPTANYRRRVPRMLKWPNGFAPPPHRNWRLIRARDGRTMGHYGTHQAAIIEADRRTQGSLL